MSVTATMLFGRPQHEIATLLSQQLARANTTSIVTGFATPGGVKAISPALLAQPSKVDAFVIGAATYPAFEALDDLLAAGVPRDRLFVHLGHSHATGTPKNPFARYHPMLHSKVYFMELSNAKACAFVGSHNVTSFALGGLNGEAGVLLEGDTSARQFDDIRNHIAEAKRQANQYTPDMKEAYAWWWREFIDGLRSEVHIPQNWSTVRTIIIFCERAVNSQPRPGDNIYFEIPDGIEQIESLKTEVHLYLFEQLPSDPWTALSAASTATPRLKCITRGVDNRQGNQELSAEWHIQSSSTPRIHRVPGGTLRPNTRAGMQQVRAEVVDRVLEEFDYVFERERAGWDPEYSTDDQIEMSGPISDEVATAEGKGVRNLTGSWQLVRGLSPRLGIAKELDQEALRLAAPDSGSFILVSLRRRRR